MRRVAIAALALLLTAPAMAKTGPEVLGELRDFRETGTVLHVAAHPDDENTQLIAYLARGRHYRTAYLSLTRGDGGQNLLGPEFGDALGLIRTEELLAARRIDGGRQFFTRARDFGYSKDVEQTLKRWNRTEVVSDIVRVIRELRPDVMITRFSPKPSRTHGHHTASAVLALEAFHLAGDPKAFPEQHLPPWQPKHIYWNAGGFQGGSTADALHLDIGGTDPASGKSFAALAAESRAMHKSQGFGDFRAGADGPHIESLQPLDGTPATGTFMSDDTSWRRVPGGAPIAELADRAVNAFKPDDPAASLPVLLELKRKLATLPPTSFTRSRTRMLDRIIADCIGLEVTGSGTVQVEPGQTVRVEQSASARVPVRWLAVRCSGYPEVAEPLALPAKRTLSYTIPADAPLTNPYWLRQEGTDGMFRVDDPDLIGRPEAPPRLPVEDVFEVGDQTVVLPDEALRVQVVPPVNVHFESPVQLFARGSTRTVLLRVSPAPGEHALHFVSKVRLELPAYWEGGGGNYSVDSRDPMLFKYNVTAPSTVTSGWLHAFGSSSTSFVEYDASGGREGYLNGQVIRLSGAAGPTNATLFAGLATDRIDIHYPHIPPLVLQPPARTKAVCLDLRVAGKNVGYLPGAGDDTAAALSQMGYTVRTLADADLTPDNLKNLDSIVLGVRALNVRKDLPSHLDALYAWVQAGGTLVEQYNTPRWLVTDRLGPYPLELSSDLPANRVTDQSGPVTVLLPDHPALNTPNKITAADFEGWVQERGLNFPSSFDASHYQALLACNDPGEAPLKSSLLVASYGKGHVVYTGLSFFRQLPAGVPGAYRLFANLVSLGHTP